MVVQVWTTALISRTCAPRVVPSDDGDGLGTTRTCVVSVLVMEVVVVVVLTSLVVIVVEVVAAVVVVGGSCSNDGGGDVIDRGLTLDVNTLVIRRPTCSRSHHLRITTTPTQTF